jgi:hypothetical protein
VNNNQAPQKKRKKKYKKSLSVLEKIINQCFVFEEEIKVHQRKNKEFEQKCLKISNKTSVNDTKHFN